MTMKFYSYSSTTSYSNIDGKESFNKIEVENNNGKKKVRKINNIDGNIEDKKDKTLKNKIKKFLIS